MGKTKIKKTKVCIIGKEANLPDVQKQSEKSGITLDKVGVKGVEWPLVISQSDGERIRVLGKWNMYVEVKAGTKGTHMSRFIELLKIYESKQITLMVMQNFMRPNLKELLEARKAHIEVEFKYMVPIEAPSSGKSSWLPVNVRFIVSDYHGPVLSVRTPVHTCCPCSKEISATGNTHNQRSWVTIDVVMEDFLWIEQVVKLSIQSASAPVVPLMKRVDEAATVDFAYENPKFVEDVAREAKAYLQVIQEDGVIGWFRVRVENEESIHVHNAFAEVVSDDVPGDLRGVPFGLALQQGNGKR